jgi:alcohol dehydrogenase
MKNYSFNLNTKIEFGLGSINKITEIAKDYGSKKVLFITDKGVMNAGIINKIIEKIENKFFEIFIYDNVESDPSTETINKIYEKVKSDNIDLLIAVGGGSSIDASKGVSVLSNNQGRLIDYAGVDKVENKGIPLIAVPTTSGTGSEVTKFAVLSNLEENKKFTITSDLISPDIAILDPELTLTLPPSITASTGLDALTHAVEAYTSNISEPISDALALESIKLIFRYLPRAVNNGKDLQARLKIMQAELLAGMAFNNAFLGLCHAIASPLGAHYHIPHGVANAVMLPYVMKFNYVASAEKFSKIAEAYGNKNTGNLYEDAYKSVELTKKLIEYCGMPNKLSDLNVEKESLEKISKDSLLSVQLKFNCRVATERQILDLLKEAF